MSRVLDYCGVRALCGREAADEMFGRKIPPGVDMDFPPDQDAVTRIVEERSRCDDCLQRRWCHD